MEFSWEDVAAAATIRATPRQRWAVRRFLEDPDIRNAFITNLSREDADWVLSRCVKMFPKDSADTKAN